MKISIGAEKFMGYKKWIFLRMRSFFALASNVSKECQCKQITGMILLKFKYVFGHRSVGLAEQSILHLS